MKKQVIRAILALGLIVTTTSYGKWHALVVGIDNYQHVSSLNGAINDAKDISDALRTRPEGIQPTVLLDRQAEYDTIKKWWADTAANTQPGDVIFFSMAGHGSTEPEHYSSTDEQGDDEVFILTGYHPKGAASRQRIVDNELFGWYKKVTDKGGQVIIVADFCYGGGMTRSTSFGRNMDDKTAKVRNAMNQSLAPEDTSKRGSASDARLTVSSPEFQHRLFIARPFSDENIKVSEKILENQWRGILSYLVAKGLRGHADSNGDGVTTGGEFSNYLYQHSRSLSDRTQDSALEPSNGIAMRKKLFKNSVPEVSTVSPMRRYQTVYVFGSAAASEAMESSSPYYRRVDTPAQARYRWDTDSHTIVESGIGEVAYDIHNTTDLLSFLQNQRLVDALKASPLPRFGGAIVLKNETNLDNPKSNVFVNGERVAIYTKALTAFPYLILINVPSKGNVQFVNALQTSDLQEIADGMYSQHVDRLIGVTQVTPPFGADHLLMLAVNDKALMENLSLRRMIDHNSLTVTQKTRGQVLEIVQSLSKDDARLTVVPFSTTEKH